MENIMLNTLSWKKNGCKPLEIPTDDEVKALNRLREIKKRVRAIKKELSNMASDDSFYELKKRADKELLDLKKEWKEWEKKRDEAARERMIALGHIDSEKSN